MIRLFFVLLALTLLPTTPASPAQLPDGARSCKVVRIPSVYRTDGIRKPFYALYLYGETETLFKSKSIDAEELQRNYGEKLPEADRTGNPKKAPQVIAGCSYKDLLDPSSGPTGDPWFELP